MATTLTPNFQRTVDLFAQEKLVLKPLIEAYLVQARFPDKFSVTFHKAGVARKPDGWFHPSTHPTWPARMLYYYLTAAKEMEEEQLSYESRMAITMGTAVHAFVEMCIRDAGLMVPLTGTCPACGRAHGTRRGQCDEYGVADTSVGVRGHMDGVLRINSPGETWVPEHPGVFEFKCLAPETPVSMADGTVLSAAKVSAGDRVLGWDEEGQRLVPRMVSSAWDNGVVPVWTVRTREGREIGTTDEHPFLTQRGWVFAKDLVVGDKVRVAFDSTWSEGHGDPDQAYFLGAMVGDGGLTDRVIKFTNVDLGVLNAVGRFAVGHGCLLKPEPDHITYRITAPLGSQHNPLFDLLRREDLMGRGSRDKRVPHSVWTGGTEAWVGFLSGYFDTDGTVVTTGSYPHLSWSSINQTLLRECQLLLGYLGIRSSVVKINGRYDGRPHQSWRLLVRDAAAVSRAMQTLHLRSARKADLLASLRPKATSPRMARTAQGGWDTISSVLEGAARPTVAIEVEGGTHVTAGIVTHNTSNPNKARGLVDNDLEMFREKWPEYYAQVQDYLEASGMRQAIVLVAVLGFPWKLIEIQVPYDPGYALELRRKYRIVREHEAMGTPPDPCCAPFSPQAKSCPARFVCPIGRLRK